MTALRRLAAGAAIGYAMGAFPSADLAARAAGGRIDLRSSGSGNPGAANAAGVLGTRWGLAVMAADIAKGAGAGALGRRLGAGPGANVASCAAVIGHCFPAHRGFRGGKGVATSVGQVLATFPVHVPLDTALAVGTVALPGLRRRAFAATAVASMGWVAMATLWWRRGLSNGWAAPPDASLPLAALVSSTVIASRFAAAPARRVESGAGQVGVR